jgi:hypothetical protein
VSADTGETATEAGRRDGAAQPARGPGERDDAVGTASDDTPETDAVSDVDTDPRVRSR